MPILTAPTFVFALGDTMRMPVTYRNPPKADGSPGDPIDLIGKEVSGLFYNPGRAPIALTVGAGLAVTYAAGLMDFVVDDAISATLMPEPRTPPFLLAEGYSYPPFRGGIVHFGSRLRARVRDPLSRDIATIALFAVRLYDPATVDLASLPVAQAGTVIAAAPDPA